MPAFDLRHIYVAQYNNNNGTITYGTAETAGGAMTANLELRFAEGRLYAEGRLAEYIREAIGGTISLGVKYIPVSAQKLLFGATEKSRTISNATVKSTAYGANDTPKYVGVSFYAPDMVDGTKKYTCVFVAKALFGPPAMAFQTKNESITFQTPTTSGEFLPDDSTGALIIDVYTADTVEAAEAWCAAVFPAAGG